MSLDIAEQQVLIDFFDDPNFHWHGRILLVALPTPGMWVVTTPDYSVQVCDLRLHRVVPLQRNADFPDRIEGGIYYFDPFEAGELEQLAVEPVLADEGLAACDARVVVRARARRADGQRDRGDGRLHQEH